MKNIYVLFLGSLFLAGTLGIGFAQPPAKIYKCEKGNCVIGGTQNFYECSESCFGMTICPKGMSLPDSTKISLPVTETTAKELSKSCVKN